MNPDICLQFLFDKILIDELMFMILIFLIIPCS